MAEKIFRKVKRDKRSTQHNPYEAGAIIGDPDRDAVLVFTRRAGKPSVEIAKPYLVAMSAFGDRYDLAPMTDKEVHALLAEHAPVLTTMVDDARAMLDMTTSAKPEPDKQKADAEVKKAEDKSEAPAEVAAPKGDGQGGAARPAPPPPDEAPLLTTAPAIEAIVSALSTDAPTT